MPERFQLFATAARGTEDLLSSELSELGASRVRQGRGLVRFHANWLEALRICLWSRIAMRVLVPLGDFRSKGAEGLYQASREVPWEEHLSQRSTFAVEATLRDSEHSHSGFVALKIKDAIADRLRDKLGARPDVDTRDPDVRVIAHLSGESLALSLDLTGEALHRRGYRVEPTVAPLKETLAAAILRAAGYKGEESLSDPLCGSGTLLIEAGLIATGRAPGLGRALGVERWPYVGTEAGRTLTELREEARRSERPAPCPIIGYDRSEEAITATRKNARAAGLSKEIATQVHDATLPLRLETIPPGLIVCNPPYGDRLKAGGQKGMKTFYFKLGEAFRQSHGWRAFVLSGNPAFESAFHAKPLHRRALFNGPIECQLLDYRFD
jgi:putative N6-adenine-specific DNA methylase